MIKQILQLLLFGFSIAAIAYGCSPKVITGSSDKSSKDTYTEDLSYLRLTFKADTLEAYPLNTDTLITETIDYPEPTHDVTDSLSALLDSISFNYRKANYISGYTIQVYLGSSSEKADEIKELVEELIPGEFADVQYRQPNYRVQIGRYVEKLEVQKTLALVKAEFPNAIVVPTRIRISDY